MPTLNQIDMMTIVELETNDFLSNWAFMHTYYRKGQTK